MFTDMLGKEFFAYLPAETELKIARNGALRGHKALWSLRRCTLHVSAAAEVLLLDPDTFQAALDHLDVRVIPDLVSSLSERPGYTY